jgi:hypothetical protein
VNSGQTTTLDSWDFEFKRRLAWRWLSSGTLRRVVWQNLTDVLKMLTASIREMDQHDERGNKYPWNVGQYLPENVLHDSHLAVDIWLAAWSFIIPSCVICTFHQILLGRSYYRERQKNGVWAWMKESVRTAHRLLFVWKPEGRTPLGNLKLTCRRENIIKISLRGVGCLSMIWAFWFRVRERLWTQ